MRIITFLTIILMSFTSLAQTKEYNILLQKYVTSSGKVNYDGLKGEISTLNNYIEYLSKTNYSTWSSNKQKAHLMNAYNAYTLKAVLDHYPIKSIKDISFSGKNVWAHSFVVLNGKKMTLTHLENNLIRKKFKDARIHVGVNCAAISCPKLHNRAFTEANVEKTLEQLMRTFINDKSRNIISADKVQLSKIFEWYKVDFTNSDDLIKYIQPYINVEINSNTEIKYLFYNWKLNKK